MATNKKWRSANAKQFVVLVIFFVLCGLGLNAYYTKIAEASLARVVFETKNGEKSPVFHLEVASRPETRVKGLMGRKVLAPDQGMLFIFPEADDHGIWMKNTYVALDVIYIGADRKVVGVAGNLKVFSLDEHKVGEPSKYIIEINAGLAAKYGISKGAKVEFLGPLPAAL